MPSSPLFPVAIIGAGPIGLELAVNLRRAGVPYVQFDARQIGHTLTWWPRQTRFFSTTERIAIAGVPIQNNHQQRISGEEYLAYLRGIVEQFDLPLHTHEPVTRLERLADGFRLTTAPAGGERQWLAQHVVLAIGDMDRPNLLHIPGEELPHVSHYFRDPHDYFRKRLLIVGGRNSAAEAALRCWRGGAEVTLSYRRTHLDDKRVKHWILPDLLSQFEAGTIRFLPDTTPVAITPTGVMLQECQDGQPLAGGKVEEVSADFVLLATGFHGDQSLLEMAGVRLHGPNRIPEHNPDTLETNIPGLYLAGTVAAGIQQRYSLFIENCHIHTDRIMRAITGQPAHAIGNIPGRNVTLPFEAFEAN